MSCSNHASPVGFDTRCSIVTVVKLVEMLFFLALVASSTIVVSTGVDTLIEEHPHQVSLEYQGVHECGGSIVSSRHVLTAASCIDNKETQALSIRAGTSLREKDGSVHQVEKYVVHKSYHHWKSVPQVDVGVVTVATPFELDATRQPIKLFNNDEEVAPDTQGVVSGWGISENGALADQLRKMDVQVKSRSFCDAAYASFGGLPKDQICAGTGGDDPCSADSGGPLVVGGRLAGIASWGGPCKTPNMPGVYIEVAKVRGWIDENVGVEEEEKKKKRALPEFFHYPGIMPGADYWFDPERENRDDPRDLLGELR